MEDTYLQSVVTKEQRLYPVSMSKDRIPCICNSGFCAAFAGLLLSSRIQTGQPAGGEGYELDAITAAVIGGASLSGGKGSVFGSFIGILVVGILTNGLDLLNVSSYYQQIIKGAIILLAVMADRKKD